MRKAQLEFIAIAGVIFLAAIVIAITYQAVTLPPASTVPIAIAEEQKLLKDSIEFLARDGGSRVIRIAETHGGYMTPQVLREDFEIKPFAMFMDNGVAYWQMCSSKSYPSIEEEQENLAAGLYEYISRQLNEKGTVGGKKVELGLKAMTVESRILDNRVDFTIDLPVKIENYSLREEYTFSVATDFGRIYKFAMAFSDELADTRALEVFTASSIYLSRDLPTAGMLSECGEVIIMTPDEVSSAMEDIIKYTVSSTLLWQPPGDATGGRKYYSIADVKGQQFKDLDISFWLPDDFVVKVSQPLIILNTEMNAKSSLMSVPYCIRPYVQKYSMAYSLITSVKDRALDSYFNFASLVYVDSMKPGDCSLIGRKGGACGDLACTANVTVTDSKGSPLRGATVSFGGCSSGETGFDGNAISQIECSKDTMSITYDREHEIFSKNMSYSEVNGTYVLHRIPETRVTFFQLNRTSIAGIQFCDISMIDNESVIVTMNSEQHNSSFLNKNEEFDMESCLEDGGYGEACSGRDAVSSEPISELAEADIRKCSEGMGKCMKQAILKTVYVDYVPGGYEYSFSAIVTNPQLTEKYSSSDYLFTLMPFISQEYRLTLPEEDSRINIYVPDTESVMDEMISFYEMRYERHHGKCLGKSVLGVCVGEVCDSNCARGLATADTIARLQEKPAIFAADLAACKRGMVEHAL